MHHFSQDGSCFLRYDNPAHFPHCILACRGYVNEFAPLLPHAPNPSTHSLSAGMPFDKQNMLLLTAGQSTLLFLDKNAVPQARFTHRFLGAVLISRSFDICSSSYLWVLAQRKAQRRRALVANLLVGSLLTFLCAFAQATAESIDALGLCRILKH